MKIQDTSTGEEYDTTDVPLAKPNPGITAERIDAGAAPEFLVECVSPSGETVTMSVVEGTQIITVDGGVQVLPPVSADNQFKEVGTDG